MNSPDEAIINRNALHGFITDVRLPCSLKNILLFLVITLSTLHSPLVTATANDIAVSGAELTENGAAAGTMKVQFNVSWNNSWRSSTNYDAAWVWVKFSNDSGGNWSHLTLAANGTNPAGFSNGTGTPVDLLVPPDKVGGFIQRNADGTGALATNAIQFVWNCSADGVTPGNSVEVKVFATEMVYIPTGNFTIGDGNGTSWSQGAFYKAANTAVRINTTLIGTIKCNDTPYDDSQLETTGIGINGTGGLDTNNDGTIDNAAYPTGYNAFYIMKYEISQGQYADFLNTLNSTQAGTRFPNQNGNNRHTIAGSWPNYSASRPDRACNYIAWADVAAYADWSGLRPLTELEYEKACRGNQSAVTGEYAWGNKTISNATTISGTENGQETVNGNCAYNMVTYSGGDGGQGPLRCGIFANGSTSRQAAGAGYYGVMELSGNVGESFVTIGNSTGRAFTGLHGDGSLNGSGNATVTNWPGADAIGTGVRLGSWNTGPLFIPVSDRYMGAYIRVARSLSIGGRCARTSP